MFVISIINIISFLSFLSHTNKKIHQKTGSVVFFLPVTKRTERTIFFRRSLHENGSCWSGGFLFFFQQCSTETDSFRKGKMNLSKKMKCNFF